MELPLVSQRDITLHNDLVFMSLDAMDSGSDSGSGSVDWTLSRRL